MHKAMEMLKTIHRSLMWCAQVGVFLGSAIFAFLLRFDFAVPLSTSVSLANGSAEIGIRESPRKCQHARFVENALQFRCTQTIIKIAGNFALCGRLALCK